MTDTSLVVSLTAASFGAYVVIALVLKALLDSTKAPKPVAEHTARHRKES